MKRMPNHQIQVNDESKIIENNTSNVPHEYSVHIQEFDHMGGEFEKDQAVNIHAEFLVPNHLFMKNTYIQCSHGS